MTRKTQSQTKRYTALMLEMERKDYRAANSRKTVSVISGAILAVWILALVAENLTQTFYKLTSFLGFALLWLFVGLGFAIVIDDFLEWISNHG